MGDTIITANPWIILPFGLLLALMAVAPMYWPEWWARHYAQTACSLAIVTLIYYLFGLRDWPRVLRMGEDYLSFIVVTGSLFVVSGGIHLNVKGEATPRVNVVFLLVGALLANVLGTTGASMLLIRPWLRMNHYRVTAHHVVFFIFIVSNVGGCLTPIGDPPLFLGYLKGVPFWWVAQHCWPMWAVAIGFLLAVFYALDSVNYHRAPAEVRTKLAGPHNPWRFEGLWNIGFLLVILGAVFIDHPPLLREGLMAAAAAGSYFTTRPQIHAANHFEFHPLWEVAVLFAGVFATMIPALDWLHQNASRLASPSPALFYCGSGVLSSLLDSAPAYLGFLNAAVGRFVDPDIIGQVQLLIHNHGANLAGLDGAHAAEIRQTFESLRSFDPANVAAGHVRAEQIEVACLLSQPGLSRYVLAISLGAVFFGANTYIGNGPNFMVKAIADHRKAKTPGFLGLVFRYTLPYMAPMLVLVWWLFLRGGQ
jgi:Na+/H+ antiporter NhaD/arsenite permease-like protein